MKSKLTKLLSLILMLAILVSSLAIFASAETDAEGEGDEETDNQLDPIVVYNRDFADGWDVNNGSSISDGTKGHNFFIDSEVTADYSNNYFVRFEAVETFGRFDNEDGFIQLSFENQNYPRTNQIYIEFDVKTDDVCDLQNVIYMRTAGGSAAGKTKTLLGIFGNMISPFGNKGTGIVSNGDWVHVQIKYDYTDPTLDPDSQIIIEVTVGEGEDAVSASTVFQANTGYNGLDFLRIGLPDVSSQLASQARAGQSWCIDNLKAYCNATRPLTEEEVDAQGYGVNVDTSKPQTVKIEGVDGEKTTGWYIDHALALKVGVNYALLNGEQVNIFDGYYGAPVEVNGVIMVPFDIILEYVGYEPYIHVDGNSYDFSTGGHNASITMGRDFATVDGKLVPLTAAPGYYTDAETGERYAVIAMDDVEMLLPGYYVTYDDMGLIIICEIDNIYNRDENLSAMLSLMNRFVYDLATGDEIYEDVKENTNFEHPYLIANQSHFDRLTAIWKGEDTTEYDIDIKKAIQSYIDTAYKRYYYYALPSSYDTRYYYDASGNIIFTDEGDTDTLMNPDLYNEDGENLYYNMDFTGAKYDKYVGFNWEKKDSIKYFYYPHVDTNGYDPDGGRQGESTSITDIAQTLAFAYAITGDVKLAQLAYEILVIAGEWSHWGPGHFLNVADASQRYAVAFDWIYNCVASLEAGTADTDGDGEPNPETAGAYKISYLEYLLFKNGTHMGYLCATGEKCPWKRPQGDIFNYPTATNNWNAVCSSGMWLASLMLLENEEYRYEASELISMNLETFIVYGMPEYAPDGDYVEGPAYWGYGTNALYIGLMGLMSSAGTDYGLFDAPGMAQTCYFVCMAESNSYEIFNYSDASEGQSVDSSSFYFVSQAINDPVIAEIRTLQINSGKGMSYRDLLYYPYDKKSEEDVELPLDYFSDAIEMYTTRSSWETDTLFAGIIGGDNDAPHGHIDSGTFVYHNAGIKWITDLGPEEYNVYDYFGNSRYRYYRASAEGHNVIAITSQPKDLAYGQLTTAGGKLISTYSNEYGSYAIIDNTAVYGKFAMQAKRGMLLTNNRQTLVVQDEINLGAQETMYWFAQIRTSEVYYEIAPNGRTMYLTSIEDPSVEVRLTIVSNGMNEKFTVTTCGETAEDRKLKGEFGTVDYSFSGANGSRVNEKDRSGYRRIAIELNGQTVNMAVVIELIKDRNQEVGYSYRPMNTWVPSENSTGGGSIVDPINPERRPKASTSAMASGIRKAQTYVESGRHYDSKLEEYYAELSNVWYHYYRFFPEELVKFEEQLAAYYQLKDEYDAYQSAVNANVASSRALARDLMGMN